MQRSERFAHGREHAGVPARAETIIRAPDGEPALAAFAMMRGARKDTGAASQDRMDQKTTMPPKG